MNFSCDKCQRRYSIADDKVRGKTVNVRCKNCQNVIRVEGPPEEAEASTRVVSLADVERLRAQERSLAEEDTAATRVALSAPSAQASQADEPTRTLPLRDTRSPWFVMVKNKQEGPLDDGALRGLVASGTVTPRSYFWQQGMPDWKRGQDIPELAELFAPAAPPPSSKAPVSAAPSPAPLAKPEPLPVEQSATSWQPEPAAPSQTTWQPQPEPLPGSGNDSGNPAPLGELFSDMDLSHSGPHAIGHAEGARMGGAPRSSEDPLASLGEEDKSRAPVENTQYFVKKAGVDRRNPPWKIALFLILLLVVPLGALYALTELQVVPLRVTRVDARGNAVQQPVSVFSAEGIGELKALLLGQDKVPPPPPPVPKPESKPKPKPEPEPARPEPRQEEAVAQPAQGEAQKEVAALYAEGDKKDVGPEVREEAEVAATDSAERSGPSQEQIARVVARSQSAFKSCVDQALRKNPKLRTGELLITATVGSSGKVKQVSFDRDNINRTYLGNCIKIRARKLVFPAFSGEDVEVEIPLVLTKSM